MRFDRELTQLTDIATSIRSQLAVAEEGRLHEGFGEVVSALRGLQERIGAAEARVLSELRLTNGMLNDMADQISDLKQAVAAQGAQLAASHSGRAPEDAPRCPADTLRVLMAATDQLGVVVAAGGPHADVVGGQRANLIRSLELLGVREVLPQMASPIDTHRARTDARLEPTEERGLDGRVFEVLESGWERIDGSELLRLPTVRVYEYTEPTIKLSAPQPASELRISDVGDDTTTPSTLYSSPVNGADVQVEDKE